MEEISRLTDLQEAFISHYLGEARFNATQAAILAGYSPHSARQMGSENLAKPFIRARIDEYLNAIGASEAEILAELRAVAFAPTQHFMQLVRPAERDEHGKEISPAVIRMDYSAKIKALELLGKAKRMFTDQVEVSVVPKAFIGIDLDKV